MNKVVELYPTIKLSERAAVIACLKSCAGNYRSVIDGWDELPKYMKAALELNIEGCNLLIKQLENKQ